MGTFKNTVSTHVMDDFSRPIFTSKTRGRSLPEIFLECWSLSCFYPKFPHVYQNDNNNNDNDNNNNDNNNNAYSLSKWIDD